MEIKKSGFQKIKETLTFKIIVSILIAWAVAAVGGLATAGGLSDWYDSIRKPSFNPPNWVFGPVWTLLYTLMGIAAGLVWDRGLKRPLVKYGLSAYGVQLVLNGLWSIFFFGMHNPLLAFADIILLLAAIATTILFFYKVRKTAAYLLIPYLLWVSFAAVLNFSIWWIN